MQFSSKIPTQLSTDIESAILNFIWKKKHSQKYQNNPEEWKNFWRNQDPLPQAVLHSNSDKTLMLLVQRQTDRSIEYNQRC